MPRRPGTAESGFDHATGYLITVGRVAEGYVTIIRQVTRSTCLRVSETVVTKTPSVFIFSAREKCDQAHIFYGKKVGKVIRVI